MIDLDGPTTGKDSFSGPIGRLCKSAESLPKANFVPIIKGSGNRELPPGVVKELSSDQHYLYCITRAIRSGSPEDFLYTHAIGKLNHSRWLTLASRICKLYISAHGLTGVAKKNLDAITEFIVVHYAPCWFEIKCEPYYMDGPRYLLKSLELFHLLPLKTRDIVRFYIERNAYFAHSENILLAMLADTDPNMRIKAINIIKKIRKEEVFGDDSPRPFHVPTLNFKAKTYDEMID